MEAERMVVQVGPIDNGAAVTFLVPFTLTLPSGERVDVPAGTSGMQVEESAPCARPDHGALGFQVTNGAGKRIGWFTLEELVDKWPANERKKTALCDLVAGEGLVLVAGEQPVIATKMLEDPGPEPAGRNGAPMGYAVWVGRELVQVAKSLRALLPMITCTPEETRRLVDFAASGDVLTIVRLASGATVRRQYITSALVARIGAQSAEA